MKKKNETSGVLLFCDALDWLVEVCGSMIDYFVTGEMEAAEYEEN